MTGRSSFTVLSGPDAAVRLAGANNEYAGAVSRIGRLGGCAVPLVAAHALPSAPLSEAVREEFVEMITADLIAAGPLDGLVVALHGACSSTDEPLADAALVESIRQVIGPTVPVVVTLDLHGNPTADMFSSATIVTGYRTNPHIDQSSTGARAVELLAAVLARRGRRPLRPQMVWSRCPAIFPDESLRFPDGPLAHLVRSAVDDVRAESGPGFGGVVDMSVFPTQPWLDAPGVGFTAVAVADRSTAGAVGFANRLVRHTTDLVWRHRHQLIRRDGLAPGRAVDVIVEAVSTTGIRPGIVSEPADAPTAGAAGDGVTVLAELLARPTTVVAAVTVCDPAVVDTAHELGVGHRYRGPIGHAVDPRWGSPLVIDAEIVTVGAGPYVLDGVGYSGLPADMGRFAVVGIGSTRVLVSELPAWSADPATWRHAGVDPFALDVLVVKSCTDFRANFESSIPVSAVAEVPGPATSDLASLSFHRCVPPPYPAGDPTLHGTSQT